MPSSTIRVQSQDQGWQTLGVERYRGVTPEGIVAVANGWGSDTINFALRRKPGAMFPDLSSWTPAEYEKNGIVVWEGRLKEAPEQDGQSFQVGVVGAGWQYHLDDDTVERMYVHTRLPDWVDKRSILSSPLAAGGFVSAFGVESGTGGITLRLPTGSTASTGSGAGVQLDLGDALGAKRVVVVYDAGAAASLNLVLSGGDDDNANAETFVLGAAPLAAGPTTIQQNFTTARRFIALKMTNTLGAPLAGGDTAWVRIRSVQVFRSTAYESGNASILKGSDVVKDVLPFAPLLSQDTSQIAAGTFNWAEFAPFDERTTRELIEATTAAEIRQAKILIGKLLRLRAIPTAPLVEIGEWSGAEFRDTSAGSGQEVYNRVKVKGTGSDGARMTVVRTQTGTIIDRFGFTRTMVLTPSMGLNTALANALGDAFLSVHKTTPLKGDVTVTGHGGVRRIEGGGVHPAHLLIHTGELLRLSHRINPDDGSWGRDGQIAQVTYTDDTESAVVSLDNQRDRFEALLTRMGVTLGAG